MKKTIAIFIALAGAFVATLPLMAETETVNGITWTYRVSNGKASVGGGSSSSPAVPKTTTGAITIPSSLGGYPVTGINLCAFKNCNGLTSVTIPDSVTSIGYSAFSGCSGLTSVTIPDSVTSIGHSAFCDCSSLTSVTIPDSVASIGDYAFSGCSGLTSVTIPNSVTGIGRNVFQGCNESIFDTTTISGVKLINGWVFGYTKPLSGSLDLNGVRGICPDSFSGCEGLVSITIPQSLIAIGSDAFLGCSKLLSIYVADGNANYTSVDGVLYNKALSQIICCPEGRHTLFISDAISSIPGSFDEVSILDTLYNIKALSISSGTTIYNSDLSNISELYFRNSESRMPYIDIDVGSDCVVYVDSESCAGRTWNDFTLQMAPSWYSSDDSNIRFSLWGGVLNISNEYSTSGMVGRSEPLYSSLEDETVLSRVYEVVIEDGIENIGDYAFAGWQNLQMVTIPDSVKRIGSHAFYNCDSLALINIPTSVTSIGENAFGNCSGLGSSSSGIVSIDNCLVNVDPYGRNYFEGIPEGTRLIADKTFANCDDMTVVTIPDSVEFIGQNAFPWCATLVFSEGNNRFKKVGNAIYSVDGTCIWEPETRATIISTVIRNDDPTVLDVTYIVRSDKDVADVRAIAYEEGARNWSNVIRPETYVMTPAGNPSAIGAGVLCNTTNMFSWKVSEDYTNNLAKLKVEIFVKPEDLLPLDLMTIPAYQDKPTLEFSMNILTDDNVQNALYWLYAAGDSGLTLANGVLKNGSTQLASGTTLNAANAAQYVIRKQGYTPLSSANYLNYINAETRLGLSPSGIRQYAVKEISE